MPSSVRPRGSGGGRAPPVTPMSERQQMALLMQMTSANNQQGSRSPSGSSGGPRRERNERGETPLHLAAIKGDVEQVSKLLAHRVDPNVTDFAGWTPLHEACNHGRLEVAARLIASGANVNARGLDDDTPLHDAASNGHIALSRLLVERGADIHAKNKKGKTPLDIAAPGIAQFLLDLNLPIPESSSSNTRVQPRSTRDDKKPQSSDGKKCQSPPTSQAPPTNMETSTKPTNQTTQSSTNHSAEDPYEFKASKADQTTPSTNQNAPNPTQDQSKAANDQSTSETNQEQVETTQGGSTESKSTNEDSSSAKRSHEENENETDEESKRKKRKDESKDKNSSTPVRNANQTKTVNKPPATPKSLTPKPATDRKSPSPKPPTSTDTESEDGKSDLKVPPLKIVIPQSGNEQDREGGARNGKGGDKRSHQALPYVVASGGEEGKDGEKEGEGKKEEKKDGSGSADDQKSGHHQRVLRSHRGPAQSGPERSTPSSPLSQSPSPNSSPAAPPTTDTPTSQSSNQSSTSSTKQSTNETQATSNTSSATRGEDEKEPEKKENTQPASTATSSKEQAAPVELHPRKRKLRPSKELGTTGNEQQEQTVVNEPHPHDQPITNCYQLYLNIRKQIERRRKNLFPVQPKPFKGFKDYLMNRCTYVLAGTAPTVPNINFPANLPSQMKELFTEQEKERYKLRMQHVIEKEKLVLSVEQEILRVHGRAARALANQSLPFSVCTVLRDEEVYNIITPEQEEKNSQRSRYNGRLFLSWLQDVDDKWEKIKESMLLRHHNEAESLHAVQKMDWEWKLKELSLCDYKVTPNIEETHVPMVHVISIDDFDLLPP